MVARLMPELEEARALPTAAPEAAVELDCRPAIRPAARVGIGALCALVGTIFGSAAQSTSFLADMPYEVLGMIPLVATLASLIGGWVAASCWMIQDEANRKSRHDSA